MKCAAIIKLKSVILGAAMILSYANAADWKNSEHLIDGNQLLKHQNSETSFKLSGFPEEMSFRRLHVYSPEAKVQVLSDQGDYELPRSNRLFFISVNTKDKAAIHINLDTGLIGGHVDSAKAQYHIHSRLVTG